MLEMLDEQPENAGDAETPLRTAYTAPSPPAERHRAFERRFGLRLVCGYGMSESVYGLIWLPGTRPFGTLGGLRQHPDLGVVNQARVVDDDGDDVPPGTPGELLLRNPTVTPGYYDMPAETAAALRDGWLHTGDLVTAGTDGTYTFVARKKDVIRRRGENLAPVKAYVVLGPGAAASAEALRDTVAARLASFKVPRFWHFLEELPRTPTGRVVIRELPGPGGPGELDLAPLRRSGAST
jgi:crotonobetaine/carnitine-CoA ligase